jgi:hypothetical protein
LRRRTSWFGKTTGGAGAIGFRVAARSSWSCVLPSATDCLLVRNAANRWK